MEVALGSTRARSLTGVSARVQPAKSRSSRGTMSPMVVSPTMRRVPLLGRNQVSWNPTRSSREIRLTEAAVPDPVKGRP